MNDLLNFFDKPTDPLNFSAIRISLASPEKIRSWSYGEVKKPETINYRTFKPERDGLFCAKIFGPVRDFECICGKFKRMKHRGIVCDKCGVEVIHSKVRRERLGHINLATPVAHIWFLKSLPSRIGAILDIPLKDVERILYSESYVVLDAGDEDKTKLDIGEVLSEEEYDEKLAEHGNGAFRVGVGAEAVLELLQSLRVEDLIDTLRREMTQTSSEAVRKKLQKRLKVLEAFNTRDAFGNFAAKPEWMMLQVIPVLPPDLRPLVPLDGGRFATSDLNDLYRRVINRNNRLLRLIELNAPDIIVRNEKRMLQEAVDALFDNGRRGKVFTGPNKRPLRSLSDFLKGKQGRFRQNLLGKRVDYSGRSVIVVGPDLKLHQCGLPKKMAIELFKPFLYSKLEEHGIVSTIKSAKKLVEKEHPEVWDILEEVTKEHPILLNRAPTLHRLGIQAFEPVLIEGKAIRLHPLVCFAFNADFDGDQMAVHLPLSIEAQMEARVLMMSTNNILSPASGAPVIVPSQDIVLGVYYLTRESLLDKGAGQVYSSLEEARTAYDHDEVGLQAPVKVRFRGQLIQTTVGRSLLSEIIPAEIPFEFYNKVMGKKELASLVERCFRTCGPKKTVLMADALRTMGYTYSTKAGLSIAIVDMIVPEEKKVLLREAEEEVKKIKEQYSEGLLTEGERYNKVVDIWANVTERIAESMFKNIAQVQIQDKHGKTHRVPSTNSIFMMADSGARGSAQQIRQLAGMRGLMYRPSGEIIETPITANFREGLTVLQYFTSTHGARKGLADTALKTASSGYLTRRLVDVAQDAIITEIDCGVSKGVRVTHVREGAEIKVNLIERILGRTLIGGDLVHPKTGAILAYNNKPLEEEDCEKIEAAGIEEVEIRNLLVCSAARGVCALCYGRDLSSGHLVDVGEAVGVIAAQSIGEPGTQLTMRTFHFGGTVTHKVETNTLESRFTGTVQFRNLRCIKNREGKLVVLSRSGEIAVVDESGKTRDIYPIVYGSTLAVTDGARVTAGDRLGEWDPFAVPIIAEAKGAIRYLELIEGRSLEERVDDITFLIRKIVIESKGESFKPALEIVDENDVLVASESGRLAYSLPVGCLINVAERAQVMPGDILAKIPREATKTKDITGGLPRVAELFEARKPKEASIMTDRDGTVFFGEDTKGKRKLLVTGLDGVQKEYLIPKGRHILVNEGDYVRKGESLVDGQPSLHEILKIMGVEALAEYLVNEVQGVYRLQGVKINDKHIEVIIRQMLRRVMILESGDTRFLTGETATKAELLEANEKAKAEGLKPADWEFLLLGITKASLSTESFISAASFQETTKVLTQASIASKTDYLRGLKENVIMGRLVPAGTGSEPYRHLTAQETPSEGVGEEGSSETSFEEEDERFMENVGG
ncbi:MAG: DNA-directed RNA polymerase subunit beta' [Oligoflexales bacterium]|nr:DNA-directed RNA polymerase subunit beta' [Oligoflexales bacterium]